MQLKIGFVGKMKVVWGLEKECQIKYAVGYTGCGFRCVNVKCQWLKLIANCLALLNSLVCVLYFVNFAIRLLKDCRRNSIIMPFNVLFLQLIT